ncbi:MAG: septum formation inhibitor Maf [Thiotrichales bacterium]|jgi:MAF protein|nr:septum formation inhibitor Maf [Thiotrichales bacterium]MBT3612710.1 septum formation inhibitor Maf [Thiotrichales bacterium]MBT3752380.1 septum formation inhibitor Maf [Thiotrichales bacterium]MBT3837115.1 septum formation inhibitor Maf [Thiotrichales bacterium]MBT4152605.1 septum formation inhibitor Maf [Thiotrichales bacterium]
MLPLILGSSSSIRKELLTRLRLPFESYSPEINEDPLNDESAEELVKRLSQEKALEVGKRFNHHLIIGSDQVAVNGESVLSKPGNFENAFAQLSAASGRAVEFLSGLTLLNTESGDMESSVVSFTVNFRNLSDAQIERYLHTEEPYNCAGSFKSEGLGITLFESLTGDDPTSLMGLPLIRLVRMLERQGVEF